MIIASLTVLNGRVAVVCPLRHGLIKGKSTLTPSCFKLDLKSFTSTV